MDYVNWHGKPYYSLDAYCKNTFHHKCYKIALNAHMTCPNRDGTLDTRGCIFCSAGGSGEFAVSTDTILSAPRAADITRQLSEGCALFGAKQVGDSFIAYFQAYTNTYAPLPYLDTVYRQALETPSVCGISIATRPDCLPKETLNLLAALKAQYPDKFIWVELGLQTIHEKTASYIRRGYPLDVFESALHNLRVLEIPVIAHIIIGLPGESEQLLLDTIHYLNEQPVWGIKLQLLHVLKNTDLATDYLAGKFSVLDKNTYITLLIRCINHLRPDMVIHRISGDGPKDLLLAPTWSTNKRDVLNSIHQRMSREQAFQGKSYQK